jgi:hypothetical protein
MAAEHSITVSDIHELSNLSRLADDGGKVQEHIHCEPCDQIPFALATDGDELEQRWAAMEWLYRHGISVSNGLQVCSTTCILGLKADIENIINNTPPF